MAYGSSQKERGTRMPKYRLYATVTGGKYLGEVEAKNEREAVEMGFDHDEAHVSVCHQCSKEISDPQVTEVTAELEEEDDGDTQNQGE